MLKGTREEKKYLVHYLQRKKSPFKGMRITFVVNMNLNCKFGLYV